MKDKILEIKKRAEKQMSEWNFPNEHYIEAQGALMVCNELLADEPAGQVGEKEIEKQLLDRFGFTDEGVNAENQLKIFSFIEWYKSKQDKEHSEKLSAFQIWEKRQKENLSDEEYRRLLFANNVIIKKQQSDKGAKEWLEVNYKEFVLHCKATFRNLPFFHEMLQKYAEQYHKSQVRDELIKDRKSVV